VAPFLLADRALDRRHGGRRERAADAPVVVEQVAEDAREAHG
jgi:hypothetical protein